MKHFTNVRWKKFNAPEIRNGYKPPGLWLSCNDDWLQWVDAEGMNWTYDYEYECTVDLTKVLILKTYKDMKEFTERYTCRDDWIHWKNVAKEYSGINIKKCDYS